MKLKNILMGCVFIFGSLTLSGCYTQLSMFHPTPEEEEEELEGEEGEIIEGEEDHP